MDRAQVARCSPLIRHTREIHAFSQNLQGGFCSGVVLEEVRDSLFPELLPHLVVHLSFLLFQGARRTSANRVLEALRTFTDSELYPIQRRGTCRPRSRGTSTRDTRRRHCSSRLRCVPVDFSTWLRQRPGKPSRSFAVVVPRRTQESLGLRLSLPGLGEVGLQAAAREDAGKDGPRLRISSWTVALA